MGATVACYGALNGWVLLSGQMPRAAALDGLLPAAFARLTGRGTPTIGLVISSAIASVLIAMNYTRGLVHAFTFLILLATLATLLPYVFSSMTGLMMALRERFGADASGGAPPLGRMVVSVLAFGFSLLAIAGAGYETVFWGFLLLVAGIPVYVAMQWRAA